MTRAWSLMLLLSILLSGCTGTSEGDETLDIMSFNLRLNLASDGENAWPHRKDLVLSMIRFHEPDIFGVQEALKDQMDDLESGLPGYKWLGVGRDDGVEAGEYMAIFYDAKRFRLLRGDHFWLSETPEKPGRGWDAAYIRIVTWGHFQDRETGQHFYHFNTHFDNRGETARRESARLILERIRELAGDVPVVLTGDFNCDPESEPYRLLTAQGLLHDTRLISQTPHHGPSRTFNHFDLESLKTPAPPIDHIFVSPGVEVLKHGTLSDSMDGRFPSDHLPVLAEIRIPKE